MKKSTEVLAQEKKNRRQTLVALTAVLLAMVLGVGAFLAGYSAYIDKILYAERLSQMREVTTQLFSGLEDAVDNQWRMVDSQCRSLQTKKPRTWNDFYTFLREQADLSDLDGTQCKLMAVDENGAYYTQEGRQGLMQERTYLMSSPERVNYVSNSMITDETQMVFLKRLETPVTVRDGDETIVLRYYGIAQNMEQLNPYFECKAYNGNSSVYVVDGDGLKLFSSNGKSGDLLKGYNVYAVLDSMSYLHGTDFADAKRELTGSGTAYSNAVLDETELYYSLYKMENAEWTLIFLVPSAFVATNTVALVNTTIRLVLMFATVLIVVSITAIFWILRKQQRLALEAERRNNDALERVNEELDGKNRELAAAVETAERAEQDARSANKAKSEFLANMSHDIRTPMNAIVGITSLMQHEQDDPEKMSVYIHKVQSSSQHLLGLINDVLDMSKIESGETALTVESINLAEQVGQVESIIRPQMTDHGHEFTITIHDIVHENLVGDSLRLRQVFINLLSNAVKYTPYGGRIRFDIAELPSSDPERAKFHIFVQDNGYGMSQEFVKRIFDPFVRAENSTTNKIQGTGLGMAITKNIVNLMGGTITVQSELNKGSRFDVELSFPIDKNAAITVNAKSVLLVSGDDMLVRNAKGALRSAAVKFAAVQTMEDAVAYLHANGADVILLSGHLQDRDLAGTVQRLRDADSEAMLIFCCDYAQEDQIEDVLRGGGVDGFVARPFFLSTFAQVIDHAQTKNEKSASETESILKGMNFLCAEDNDLNAEILDAILDMSGATCTIYADGNEIVQAFEKVKPGEYDAILMDVQMPNMNGLDATRAIRNGSNPLGKTIPILAMTANAFSSDV
ncbi:ATP-binding protein [Gemmiger sp.]